MANTTGDDIAHALSDDGHAVLVVTRRGLADAIEASLATWPQADAQDFARLLRRFVDQAPFAADHD
ncbi:hypothetical protein [Kitasatospora sp. NPDC088346]|uniref:hypothetical protein n=1 Tax=Kitasatospora sp. NPDC088346 TaxID=3364073 RepID=UPI00382B014F